MYKARFRQNMIDERGEPVTIQDVITSINQELQTKNNLHIFNDLVIVDYPADIVIPINNVTGIFESECTFDIRTSNNVMISIFRSSGNIIVYFV